MKKVPGDIIILYMCTINHLIYGSWDKKQDKQRFYSILGHFLLFWAKISKTMKNIPGDITILHKCTKNHDHMFDCSWDMMRDGFYFLFWAIF